MKTKNKPHFLLMAGIVAVFAAFTVSCNKDNDPSLADLREDKLEYLEDSLRISDSLKRINAAGVVNYAINVVSGSTSTIFSHATGPGRENGTKTALDGAIVTISQYGKTLNDTTDASGMVVFTGFFRTTVNVTIRKEGFTTVSYAATVNLGTSTSNGTISFVGNIIPIFELTGANTATISGRATIETNLTNKTRELAPDGTKVLASIDAKDASFATKYLTTGIDNLHNSNGDEMVILGEILQASYQSGVVGSVTAGNYTITVPAAIDGLPTSLTYSEIGADQTLFESAAAGQRTLVQRTIFNDNTLIAAPLATLPVSSAITIAFANGTGAAATAVVSENAGTLDKINLTADGSGYIAATPPVVEITGGSGTGATATAVVGANGRVTAVNLTNPGTGYTSAPTVTLVSGTGANATAGLAVNGTVTTVLVTNSGSGYTAAPAVTFNAPGGTGVTALGSANIDGSGRVVSISITNPGSGYIADPGAVTIGAPPAGGIQATATALYSGQSVSNVTVTGGANYTYAPKVTFTPTGGMGVGQRVNGTAATGIATVDPVTRQVTGIQITSPGSGYLVAPTITLDAGSGATATAFITGGTLTNANITVQGTNYVYAPTVVIGGVVSGGGQGATATAVLVDGKVVGLNIINPGSGYTSAPDIAFVNGDNANAYATVTNGAITGVVVTDGGRNFNGAPRVTITSLDGGGATATATVAGGQITGVTVTAGGTGYLEGNTPGSAERFSATKGLTLQVKRGTSYVNDIHYGTGAIRQPN